MPNNLDFNSAKQRTRHNARWNCGRILARDACDDAAQMQTEYQVPVPRPLAQPARAATYDADNGLETFNGKAVAYDLDGNMTSGPLKSSTPVPYTYDARNRLAGVDGVTCGYDSEGNRTSLTRSGKTTTYVINPAPSLSQVLIRTKPDGTKTFYVYGAGLLYEVNMDAAGAETGTLTYHYDYRGSTVALTDDSGKVVERFEYNPYGLLTFRSGVTDTPFLFNGRYGVQSDSTGLLYMRARYYNPFLCRFINADPAGFEGGMNFYAYADGNPVSYLDPFGLGAIGESGGSSFATRAWGGLEALSGGMTATFGYTFGTVTAPTLVGGIAGAWIGGLGLDMFQAGIRQMWTGQKTPTMLNSTLQAAGMSPAGAARTEAAVGLLTTGSAGIYALSSRVNSISTAVAAAETGAAIRTVTTLADQDVVVGFVRGGQIIKQATLGSDFATAISHEQLAIQAGVLQSRGVLTQGVEAFTVVKQNGQVLIRGSNNFVPAVSPATEALLRQSFR